jgi:hypothetical protein
MSPTVVVNSPVVVKRLRDAGSVNCGRPDDDEVQWTKEHGVDIAFNVYAGAGLELADQVSNDEAPRAPVEPADDGPGTGS